MIDFELVWGNYRTFFSYSLSFAMFRRWTVCLYNTQCRLVKNTNNTKKVPVKVVNVVRIVHPQQIAPALIRTSATNVARVSQRPKQPWVIGIWETRGNGPSIYIPCPPGSSMWGFGFPSECTAVPSRSDKKCDCRAIQFLWAASLRSWREISSAPLRRL